MVKDGGGWWKKAEPQPTAGHTSTNLHQLPPSSTPSCSPAHLHLNHGAVVTHLWSLLPKHFVVGDHLEVVATPEILDAREISGLPIAGDAIARVELIAPVTQPDPPRHRDVRAEGVPAPRVHSGPAILLIDVLGARGGPLRPVHALGVDADAVAVALERSAQVEASNRGEYGAREIGHTVVGVARPVRTLAIYDRALHHDAVGQTPFALHADVAFSGVHDARALGGLKCRGAEQRLERIGNPELADGRAPPSVRQLDPEIGGREGERRGGGGRRGADGAQLDLGAVRRPRRDAPFHREPGAPQEVRRGVTERLEARLEVAGELWRRRGGSRRLSQRRAGWRAPWRRGRAPSRVCGSGRSDSSTPRPARPRGSCRSDPRPRGTAGSAGP